MEEYTHCLNAALDELCVEDDYVRKTSSKGRMGRRKYGDNHDSQFKSKNLGAERRRREKLSQRLLNLRSIVPVITNMNKATIIEDSITYITELKKNVKRLQGQLLELDQATAKKELEKSGRKGILMVEDETCRMTNIEGSCVVRVMNVEEEEGKKSKWWMKMIFEKKRGRITKLVEALTSNGFQLTDTTLTTSHGTVMFSSTLDKVIIMDEEEKMLDPSTMTNLLQGILANL